MRRVRPTSQVRFSPFVEGTAAPSPQPGPPAIISFLFIQHIVSGLRVVRRSIRHRLFLPASRPASRDLLRYQNTFRKTSYSLLCSASKGGFHCNFHFYIMAYALRQRRDARRHVHSYIFFSSFFGRT